MRPLGSIVALTAAALLSSAGSAQAADYCVVESQPSCSLTFSSVREALQRAEAISGPDRVLIGHGDFVAPSGGWSYNAADPVEIRGFGPGETVLRQASPTAGHEDLLRVTHSGLGRTLVTQLGFVVGEAATITRSNAALVLGRASDASDLAVELAPGADVSTGIEMTGDTTLRDSDFAMASSDITIAVRIEDTAGSAEVEDVSLDAFVGVSVEFGVTADVHRAHIKTGFDGVVVSQGSTAFANDVIVELGHHATPTYAFGVSSGSASDPAEIDVRNATVTGGDSSSHGLYIDSNGSAPVTGTIVNSIVDTPGSALHRHATGAAAANLTADHNHFRAGTTIEDAGGPGTLTNTNSSTDDPRFLGDPALGEFRLRYDSPYVDAGDPAGVLALGGDFAGDPRIVDGDGDGNAKPDLGALEYQRRAPVGLSVQATPMSALVGSPFDFSAAATDPDGDPLSYGWSWDDGASGSGASVSHSFSAAGSHTGTATVTDATGLSASGSATVQVDPPADPPPPPPPPPPPDVQDTGPRLSILRRGLRLSRTNRIPIRVLCSALVREPCAGNLTIASRKRVAPRKRILRLGRASFSVAPGKAAILRVKVSKRNARIARHLRKIRVIAIGVTRDSAGKKETVRRPATLIAATPKRKRQRLLPRR